MSMSRKKCCVPGCMESRGSHKTLHLFPNPTTDRERFSKWVSTIGGDILGLEDYDIYKHRSVCHAHFEEKFCCRNNRLSNIAVPTLSLPGSLSLPLFTYEERRPMRQMQNYLVAPDVAASSATTLFVPPDLYSEPQRYDVMQEDIDPVTKQLTARKLFPTLNKPSLASASTLASLGVPCSDEHNQENKDPMMKQLIVGKLLPTLNKASLVSASTSASLGVPCSDEHNQENKDCHEIGIGTKIAKKHVRVTPAEQRLYRKLLLTRVKLSKCRNKIKKTAISLKAAKKITTNRDLQTIVENLPSAAKLITMMQFREGKKREKGRRFTLQEKLLALSIFKQAPKGYRFLRKILILPTPQTLGKLISSADIKPGINEKIFSQIKKSTERMKESHKLCVLLFDEISLKANISFNERRDRVLGFVTDGRTTKPEFADHAQVFMIRGLTKNYKQPISYSFAASATSGQQLSVQIKEIISKLLQAGIIVLATVCDQGANNRLAIKLLLEETRGIFLRKGQEPRENIIVINDKEVVPLYDPPHLLKCIRNNLLTKNLEYYVSNSQKCIAKWEHLILLLNENPGYKGVRLIPKLTENHVLPEKVARNKMKVKFASQIFSRTVATNMGYLADKGILPTECKETADCLIFFDNLFDSMNGSFNKKEKRFAKPLLGPVTPTSAHHEEWAKAKKMLNSMKFINRMGVAENVPTLKNWVWTLDGIQVLLKKLEKDHNVTSVWLRHLNQDPLENFFGAIRSHGCRNTNPTPDQFEGAFTTLLINNMSSVHAPASGNCEQDFCQNLNALIVSKDSTATLPVRETDISGIEITIEDINNKNDPRIIAPLKYITGYFVKKTKSKVFKECNKCKINLINLESDEYIQYREYGSRQWLCSPTQSILNTVSAIQDITYKIIKENLEKENIKELIKTYVLFLDFTFLECELHKEQLINYLINLTTRFFLYNYCKDVNGILSGKKECHDYEDKFQMKAKKYYKKCMKRPRK